MVDNPYLQSVDRRTVLKTLGAGGVTLTAGCLGDDSGTSQAEDVTFDLSAIQPDELVGQGPFGEDPSPADSVALSDSEEDSIADGDYTIEVVFHFREDTWTQLQETAITNRCSELGINITGIHYAEFDPEIQSNILESVAGKNNVDGILSIPVDIEATRDAYLSVSESGKEIVFMDNVPSNFEHLTDYAGVVAADNRGMGVIGGRMMESLLDSGKIILLEHDVPFYVTNERYLGIREVLEENDDFELETVGFIEPGNVLPTAQNTLSANPDATGLWAPWVDPPGAQAVQAINEQGMNIPVTSCDVGERSGTLLAERSPLKGVGSQDPLAQGLAEVNMIAKRFLGEETPPYIALPATAVARQNLLETYPDLVGEEPPASITSHFE